MPARWASSQRPLFVRTVWVNGLRHAILTPDDPVLQPTARAESRSSFRTCRSSLSGGSPSSSHSSSGCEDQLEHCLIKLQLVLSSKNPRSKPAAECPVRCCESHRDPGSAVPTESRRMSVAEAAASMVGHYRRPYVPHHLPSSSEEEAEEDVCKPEETWHDLESLSERVLQWLDLAGRAVDTTAESRERKPHRRRRALVVSAPAKPRSATESGPEPLTVRGLKGRRRRQVLPEKKAMIGEPPDPAERMLPPFHYIPQGAPASTSSEPPTSQPPEMQPTNHRPEMHVLPTFQQSETSRSRPQLHIFMPSLRAKDADYGSECGSHWSNV